MLNRLIFAAVVSILVSGCLTAETPTESVASGASELAPPTGPDGDDGPICGPSAEAFADCVAIFEQTNKNCEDMRAQGQAVIDRLKARIPTLPPDQQAEAWAMVKKAEAELAANYQACLQIADALYQECIDDACELETGF